MFEIIVVDQNDNYRIEPLLGEYPDLPIQVIKSRPGLSRSRNRGLEVASGSLCAFPDDDCWYPPGHLHRVVGAFRDQAHAAGIHGKGSDPQSGLDMARFDSKSGAIKLSNVLERSVSCALFYRLDAVRAVGGFDEELGLGSGTRWTGCEDYDLPIRMIKAGMRLHYDSTLVSWHPCPTTDIDASVVRRAETQSPSFGLMLTGHRLPFSVATSRLARPLAGALLGAVKLDRWKAKYHAAAFLGRSKGALRGLWAPTRPIVADGIGG